ncbi:hypothetical protein IEE94_13000 [Yimella sp. cx-573]|nr:hypothetical protein [Yimella sp. cx-573]
MTTRKHIVVGSDERDESGQITNVCAVVEQHRAAIEVGFASMHTRLGC